MFKSFLNTLKGLGKKAIGFVRGLNGNKAASFVSSLVNSVAPGMGTAAAIPLNMLGDAANEKMEEWAKDDPKEGISKPNNRSAKWIRKHNAARMNSATPPVMPIPTGSPEQTAIDQANMRRYNEPDTSNYYNPRMASRLARRPNRSDRRPRRASVSNYLTGEFQPSLMQQYASGVQNESGEDQSWRNVYKGMPKEPVLGSNYATGQERRWNYPPNEQTNDLGISSLYAET